MFSKGAKAAKKKNNRANTNKTFHRENNKEKKNTHTPARRFEIYSIGVVVPLILRNGFEFQDFDTRFSVLFFIIVSLIRINDGRKFKRG